MKLSDRLGQGVGVCEGIAKAVKVLLDALGVWCVIAICGNNPEKGIKYRHTWNIVKIGGTYYHLDATFDNTLGKDRETSEIRYDYFNLDDSQIFRDHEPSYCAALTAVIMSTFTIRRRSFLLLRKRMCITFFAGGEERQDTYFSLERRLSDKGSTEGIAGAYPESRR